MKLDILKEKIALSISQGSNQEELESLIFEFGLESNEYCKDNDDINHIVDIFFSLVLLFKKKRSLNGGPVFYELLKFIEFKEKPLLDKFEIFMFDNYGLIKDEMICFQIAELMGCSKKTYEFVEYWLDSNNLTDEALDNLPTVIYEACNNQKTLYSQEPAHSYLEKITRKANRRVRNN